MNTANYLSIVFWALLPVYHIFPCTAALAATDLPVEKISLSRAWRKVEADNSGLAAAKERIVEAKSRQDAAKDLYWPEINLSGSYIYLDDDITISPADILGSMADSRALAPLLGRLPLGRLNGALTSTIAKRQNVTSSIQAGWPIYTGGRINAAQDIAAARYDEAREMLTTEVQKKFEKLIRFYFGAILRKQVHSTRLDIEKGLKKHRDHAVLLEKQGQIARVERMQSEASYDKAKVERQKAGRDLKIALLALTRMLNNKNMAIPSDTLFINEKLPPLQSFIEKTLATHPGLAILKAKEKQAASLISVEKGKYKPLVALFGTYNLYEEDNLATKLMPDWLVGITIKIPLLTRSGRGGKLEAARSMVRQIKAVQSQAESDLSLLVEKNYHQARQALEEYRGLGSSLELARETVNLRTKAFNQGLSTSLDVVDAQLFLGGVKTQRAVAIFNYDTALAKLLVLSGQLKTFFQYQKTEAIEVP